MEFKKYKLGEICQVVPGFAFKSKDFGSGTNIAVKIKDITPNGINLQDADMVSFTPGEKFKISQGDYVMAMTGATIGKIGILRSPKANVFINQRVCKFEAGDNVDKAYLYYILKAGRFYSFILNNVDSSSAQPNIGHPTLYNYEISLPPLEEQKKIAGTLALIDRKIELCEAQNRTLEKLARQIYDYWFVQFDFPDENGKPYKSSGGKMVYNEKLKRQIPEGWEVGNICKIAEILSGGTPSKKVSQYWNGGTIPFFGPTDCDEHIFQIQTEEAITEEGLSHCASSLLDFGTIIITARGSIGKLVIVGTPMAMNQSCYALKSTKGEFEYLYFISIQLIELLKKKGSGSVFKSIITPDIENSMLLIGCEKLNSKFCAMVNPCFSQIFDNQKQIQTLTSLRERLLPLLMNGQVEVCD